MRPYYLGICISASIREHDYSRLDDMLDSLLVGSTVPNGYYLAIAARSGAWTVDSKYPEIYANKNKIPYVGLKPDCISYGGGLALVRRDEDLVKMCYAMIIIDGNSLTQSLINMNNRCGASKKVAHYLLLEEYEP